MSTLIPEDKFLIFMSLFRFPIKTVNVTAKVKTSLSKVFDGQNPVYRYNFKASELLDDWLDFITNVSENPNRWRTEAMDVMMDNINSVVIIDSPSSQTSERPEPYFYFVDVCHFIDWNTVSKGKNEMAWCVFRKDKETIVVIDETSYRTFYYENDPDKIKETGFFPHDIKYCPASLFWSEYISMDEPDLKLSPFTTHLAELDWLAYLTTSKQHVDTYAGFPIYSAYERDCDYQDESETMGYVKCDRGFLRDENSHYMSYGGSLAKCPVCSNKRIAGAGTYYEIPKPGPDNDNADMRNPVQITGVDKDSLEYLVAECERLKDEIHQNIAGFVGETPSDQAVNVKQIMAAFESRTAKLRDFKKNFERIMEFAEHTQAKIRYGDDFVGLYIDLGTDFYFYESQFLLDVYHTARESEAEDSILDTLLDQYYTTKYRNSPDQLKREQIIMHLDPCRHVSRDKAAELAEKGLIDVEVLHIKLNFSTFVKRFEREQAPLIDFGRDLPFDKRVSSIKQIIKLYANEETYIERAKPAGTGGAAGGGAPKDRAAQGSQG